MTPSDGYGRRQVMAILSGLLLATLRRVARPDRRGGGDVPDRREPGRAHRAGVGDDRVPDHLDDLGAGVRQAVGHPRAQAAVCGCHRRVPGRVGAVRVRGLDARCWRRFRAFQGVGAGGILTLTSAVMGDVVAPRDRAKYGGWFVAVYAVASVVGPVTGGALAGQRTLLGVDGWRWIFLLNLPVGVAACVVVTRVLRAGQQRRRQRRLDLAGTLTLMIAAVPLLLVASRGQAWGWGAASSAACYAIGALGVAGFLLAERRAGDGALLTLRLFRNHGFAIGAGQSLVVQHRDVRGHRPPAALPAAGQGIRADRGRPADAAAGGRHAARLGRSPASSPRGPAATRSCR